MTDPFQANATMKKRGPKTPSINVAVSKDLWAQWTSMSTLRGVWARKLLEDAMTAEMSRWEQLKGLKLRDLLDFDPLAVGADASASKAATRKTTARKKAV